MAMALALLVGLEGWTTRITAAEAKGELSFQLQLIWGTNDEKPPGKDLKEVEARITEGFKGMFKWKNYFEVTRKNLAVPTGGTKRIQLSEKCEVEVQNLGNSSVEVRLFGEGKYVNKVKQTITPGKLFSIGGGDKNDTAWFVVLKPL
jgi:hypothetical protein